MFRSKIVWLGMLCLLPVSTHTWAADTEILVGRAHYWHKLGRTELEIKAWREVLQAEPDNAEAKAGLEKAMQLDNVASLAADSTPVGTGQATGDPIADWLAESGAAPRVEPEQPLETTRTIESAAADKAATLNETAAKTAPAEAVAEIKTAPVVEPATASVPETATAVEAAPVVETTPAAKTASVEAVAEIKAAPVVESAPAAAAETAPAVNAVTEVKAEVKPVTAVEAAPVVETAPAVKTEPDIKSAKAPTVESPAAAPVTVTTTVPVVESAVLPVTDSASIPSRKADVPAALEAAPSPKQASDSAAARTAVSAPTAKPISEAADAVAPQATPVVAKPLVAPAASRSGVDLGALQEELKSAQTERISESRLLGLKKTQPDAVGQGGSLVPDSANSSQALLERAAYWDKHGRRDLAAKLRQQAKVDAPDVVGTSQVQPSAISETSNGAEPSQSNSTMSPEPPAQLKAPTETLADVAKPTRQELTERAKYWEVRGRNDLAEKLNIQAAKAEPAPVETVSVPTAVALPPAAVSPPPAVTTAATPIQSSVVASPAVTSSTPTQPEVGNATPVSVATPDSRNSGSVAQGGATLGSELAVQPTSQEIADKAQYWAEHGRPDLAQQLKQKQPVKAVVPEKAPEVVTAKVQGETGTLGSELAIPPSQQDIADKAQYWAAHGRNDLAEQLKKKLQQMQPDRRLGTALPDTAGDHDAKRSALEDYLLKNPNSLKARLDLSKIYRSIGEFAKAREQIDSVLMLSPDLPDALFASAQLYADQRLWWEALQTLEKISPVARTAEMGRLQKIGWAHVQIDRADAMVRQGDNRGAELLLRRVAAELVVNYNETALPEPPPLWNSGVPQGSKKSKRARSR